MNSVTMNKKPFKIQEGNVRIEVTYGDQMSIF
jgi:hypothetical protein